MGQWRQNRSCAFLLPNFDITSALVAVAVRATIGTPGALMSLRRAYDGRNVGLLNIILVNIWTGKHLDKKLLHHGTYDTD